MFSKKSSEKFEKIILRKNKSENPVENLEDLSDKSYENIQKTLINRNEAGEDYTFAGKHLVHIDRNSFRLNRLLNFTENIYENLKASGKTQVVSFLGSSLKSKEFNKNRITSHLTYVSSSSPEYMEIVQSAYELVSIFGTDGEFSYYAECLDLQFDTNFCICGCFIRSKVVDLDVNKSSGIFRILFSLSDATLQHLGLAQRVNSQRNSELYQKFKTNLDILGIPWSEAIEVMEILAVSLLLDDVKLATSSFTLAGSRPVNSFSPADSRAVKKICKTLGLIPSRLIEFLTTFNKQHGVYLLESFKKILILTAFEGLIKKINMSLAKKARELNLGSRCYTVKILSFPGPKLKDNIDGLISNLITECFEFMSYENYLSILSTFNEEKIPAAKLSVPRSRYLTELFFDKSFGVLLNFHDDKFWNNLIQETAGDSVYNKIISIEEGNLTLNFSWGSFLYDLNSLKTQFSNFPDRSFQDLLLRGSNGLIKSVFQNPIAFNYKDYVNQTLSDLLSGSFNKNLFILFTYKDVKDLVFESSVVSILNIPYKYLIKKNLISPECLKKNGLKASSSENFYYFEDVKDHRKIFNGIQLSEISGVTVASDLPIGGLKLSEFIDEVARPLKTIPRSFSAKIRTPINSVSNSKGSTKLIKASLKNFKNYSFRDYLNEIVRIQAFWRGYSARRYCRSLALLHKSALKIQSIWRGWKLRKKFNFKNVLNCLKIIQRIYKRWYLKKSKAAQVIQKFYLSKKYLARNLSKNNYRTFTFNSLQKTIDRFNKTKNANILYSFKPKLSKKTEEIAKKMNMFGYSNMKIEDRLLRKGREMEDRKEIATINKKKKNENTLKTSCSVKNFNKRFYEDNLKFVFEKKNSLKKLRIKKDQQEMKNCTFTPCTNNKDRPRSALETVNDLYNWNLRKNKKVELKRKEAENESAMKMGNYKMSDRSDRIFRDRKTGEMERLCLISEVQKKNNPYWPNNH